MYTCEHAHTYATVPMLPTCTYALYVYNLDIMIVPVIARMCVGVMCKLRISSPAAQNALDLYVPIMGMPRPLSV